MHLRAALLVVCVFVVASFVTGMPVHASASQPSSGSSLSLTLLPPKLPADGGSYQAVVVSLTDPSGLPVVTLESVTVYLSSELPSVADVSTPLTIPAGSSYAVANVTTSATPGSTQITASAEGLKTASATVQTVIPSGFPDHLAAFAVPSVQLARTFSQGEIVVQVQDDLGIPARTASSVSVSLSSSDNRILTGVAPILTIPAHQSEASSNYTTGLVTGTADILASASGFSAAFAEVEVVRAPPLVLKVTVEPDIISASSSGRIVVSLTDRSGAPAEAPADITVFLTSSNLTVAVVTGTDLTTLNPATITIQKDQVFAETTFSSLSPGNATITGSAHGLTAGFAEVSVAPATKPTELRLFFAPNPVPSTGKQYPAIAIGLANTTTGAILPSKATKLVHVVVTASDNATGRVLESFTVDIMSGDSYAAGMFNTTLLPSVAVVTAAAQNLASAQSILTTSRPVLPIGPAPSRIAVAPVAPSLPADGDTYQGLLVSLQDSSGGPAIAPAAITVHLSVNRSNVIQVIARNESTVIPAGQSFSIVFVRTLSVQGTVNITAESPGYSPSWTLFSTKALSPARLALYVAPSPAMQSANGDEALLAVQLQDSGGNPARAREATAVTVTSSNGSLLPRPAFITIPTFSDYVLLRLSPTAATTSELTAISPGLSPAAISFSSSRLPAAAVLSASSTLIYPNQTATLTVSVSFLNSPVVNATVGWQTSSGTLGSQTSKTGQDGTTSVTLTPTGTGIATVKAFVQSPTVGSFNLTSTLVITSAPVKPAPSLAGVLLGYAPYIGGGVVAAALVTFFILRRRKATVEEEAFETSLGEV